MKTQKQIKRQIIIYQSAYSDGRGETDEILKASWEALRWVLDEDEGVEE